MSAGGQILARHGHNMKGIWEKKKEKDSGGFD